MDTKIKAELVDVIAVHNTLGEGVVWDARDQSLWWTDILASKIYHMDWLSRAIQTYTTPERVCSFGLTEQAGVLIVAFESGFGFYQPEQNIGQIKWMKRFLQNNAHIRLNDGRMDRQGRFWAGSMVEAEFDQLSARGKLYSCDVAGNVGVHISNILIANSLCWSPDSKYMYFADSPTQTIFIYNFDPDLGIASDPQIFSKTEASAFPDGSDVDGQGNLWNAEWAGGRVTKYSPAGIRLGILELPVSQPTCVAFGGSEMNLLFITTARESLCEADLKKQPEAGNLFVYKMENKGLTAPVFGRDIDHNQMPEMRK